MSWKQHFSTAVQHFRQGDIESALASFNQAIENGGKAEYIVYDSRSSVLEKFGQYKEALKDARTTIQLAPDQWQGYARAARLFHRIQKFDSAMKMVEVALKKLKEDASKRRNDLLTLKNDISLAHAESTRRTTNHWSHLPIELFAEIALTLVQEEGTYLIPLSHVCKDWRRVIWDNPHLWSTLVLGRSRPHVKAKRWVEQSKGNIHTLRVLAVACDRSSWSGEGLDGMRWNQLRVCKVENWDLCKYLDLSRSLSSLSSLNHFEYNNEDRFTNIQHPFHISWPIQHLSLTSVALPACFSDLAEKNLLSLALRKIQGQVKLVLEPQKGLEILILDSIIGLVLEDLPDEMPALRHLEIRRMTRPMIPLLNLGLPQLNTLHIESSPFALGFVFDSLQTKCSGHLTTLVLRGVPFTEPHSLIELLRCNSALKTLELSRIHTGVSNIVEALASPPLESTSPDQDVETHNLSHQICPNITHLDLSHCHDLRTGSLVRLIRSRHATSPSVISQKISALIVDGCEQLDPDWLPWFRSNVELFSWVNWSKKSSKHRR